MREDSRCDPVRQHPAGGSRRIGTTPKFKRFETYRKAVPNVHGEWWKKFCCIFRPGSHFHPAGVLATLGSELATRTWVYRLLLHRGRFDLLLLGAGRSISNRRWQRRADCLARRYQYLADSTAARSWHHPSCLLHRASTTRSQWQPCGDR